MVDATLALDPQRRYMLLAPVVRERKGEHLQVFEQLRAQGFVRARIDGKLCDLDAVPTLALRVKHTIEAVVDRFRPAPDLKQRLAESFETALRLGEGLAIVADHDDAKARPTLYSSRFACPVCDYSLSELEPRLFSFNSPVGACAACDGLGVTQFFDPARVVVHPELSLAAGAVRGWDRRNAYYFQLVMSLARHYRFEVDTPWRELPERIRKAVLHGSGEEEIAFRYASERGGSVGRKHRFEGILPNLERRYKETESPVVREELAKFISSHPCPDCGGQRLNRAARHVFVAGRNLPRCARCRWTARWPSSARSTLAGWRGEIAAKIVKEIRERLRFLVDVGLDYLTLDRQADTLSGGEAQRIRLASQIGAGLVGVMYVLDEPSIGLHQRDNERLLGTLTRLRDLGNTVHRGRARRGRDPRRRPRGRHRPGRRRAWRADRGAGHAWPTSSARRSRSPAQYLSGKRRIAVPERRRRRTPSAMLRLLGARGNNLHDVDLEIPAGLLRLRHRRVRLGQVHADQRHPVPARGPRAERRQRAAGAVPQGRGARALRQGGRHRPDADRAHAALEPGDLHRPVHADARALCAGARSRARAATARAASASTSRAVAARPARATG